MEVAILFENNFIEETWKFQSMSTAYNFVNICKHATVIYWIHFFILLSVGAFNFNFRHILYFQIFIIYIYPVPILIFFSST